MLSVRSIAFFPVTHLHLPHNYREYYLSMELTRRKWDVRWLRPASGTNRGVELEWPVLEFPDLDVRGRKYILPAYLAQRLRAAGIRILWLSGWNIRDLSELHMMVRILRVSGIHVVYDPIDPICEFLAAQAQGGIDPAQLERSYELARKIYHDCDLVVSVTPELRDLLAEHGAPADRIIVGRWGTDASRFDRGKVSCDLKERLGLDPRTFLVGWLGTMEPFKGLEEMILPLIESIGEARPDFHFVIAGRGTLEPRVRQWAAERPQLPVTIMPTVPYDDAPNFTGSLDAYLVPTNPNTEYARSICPVKCFDALAMGTPLIVTRTPATSFLEESGAPVRLVDFDRDSFQNALLELQRAKSRPGGAHAVSIRTYSHQTVSVTLADAIDDLADRVSPRNRRRRWGASRAKGMAPTYAGR